MEQEFFLVDERGVLSDRADEFLARCAGAAREEGLSPEGFVAECTMNMVEINTTPAATLADLEEEYFGALDLALRVGRGMGIRLYPLAAYPLPVDPAFREEPSYSLQADTVGRERFTHAGRCVGTHLHLETAEGTVDPEHVVSPAASPQALSELLSLYNLAVALDPAIVALTRSSPFYEGRSPGLAVRTAHYRGSAEFGWEGVYTHLPLVGGLRPYVADTAELVSAQRAAYRAWVDALERAGFDEAGYVASGGALLKAHWGPVRIGGVGTVEMRGIDGNLPRTLLAVVAVVQAAARRVRSEGLTVTPSDGMVFEPSGGTLLVPDFSALTGGLLHAAATTGPDDPDLTEYLDSVLRFAAPYLEDPGAPGFLRPGGGRYVTTEARVGGSYPAEDPLSPETGLRIVLDACEELERQVVERGTLREPAAQRLPG